jgi:hypothetical protein
LIAFAIVIVLLLVYAIQGCQSSSKHAKYDHYMTKVSQIAASSRSIGTRLTSLLGQPGLKANEVQTRLAGLARDEQQNVDAARAIDPPGRLREEHTRLIDALQYRYSGIVGIADSLRQAVGKKSVTPAQAGALLVTPSERLVASDVVYADSFRDPSKQVLRDQGVGDVRVPSSAFIQNPDFYTANGLAAVVTRLRGVSVSPTAGGLHGTNIVTTKALPKGIELSTSTRQPVPAGTNLGFAVTIEDSGDSVEVHIPVTLTISGATGGTAPIVKNQVIDLISPKEQKTITFRNIQLDPAFFGSQSTSVKVKVNAVPNEHNVANNSAEYPVIFSLP